MPAVSPMQQGAKAVVVTNPFAPFKGRKELVLEKRVTIRVAFADLEIHPRSICVLNGEPILRPSWDEIVLSKGDLVQFINLPAGGGGGGGGKNPLKTVLMLAVMVAAPYGAGMLAPEMAFIASIETALGMTATSSIIGMQVLTGAVALTGSMLVNTVVPSPKPATPSMSFNNPYGGSAPAPSPTYSMQARGNQARLGQVYPELFGKHIIYPDRLTLRGYTEYVENEQYFHDIYAIGIGDYEILKKRYDDTPFSSFSEVEYEIIPPGGAITLIDKDVVTAPEVAGQECKAPNDEGDFVGPYVINPSATVANFIGIDVICPRGLYYANNDGSLGNKTVTWDVVVRKIDDAGEPLGEWIVVASETVTDNTNTAIRKSYKYPVEEGRYEAKLKRTDNKDQSSRAGHELRWGQARAYLTTGGPDLSDITTLVVKIRATDNLNQNTATKLNVIAMRKLPIWNAETKTWSEPLATQSISAAFAYIAKSKNGGALPDSRLPLDELDQLEKVWTARGDTFNAVFDTQTTVWDALQTVARCGRAVPIQQRGLLRCIRDTPQSMPTSMFGIRNIVKGSFEIEYILPSEDTADLVKVEYYDEAIWNENEVIVDPDGMVWEETDDGFDDLNLASVKMLGVTNGQQAEREAVHIATDNAYRRIHCKFSTGLEGMIPTYGDLIAVSHPMPDWGTSGEVETFTFDQFDEETGEFSGAVIGLSEPVSFKEGENHYLGLRKQNGDYAGLWLVNPDPDDDRKVLLGEVLTFEPYVGGSAERTYFSFGLDEDWARLCRVLSVRPRGNGQVEIKCVVEDQRAHPN